MVTGEYEERTEDGSKYLSRHFVQRFFLPRDASLDGMTTNISEEGILTIRLPRNHPPVKGSDEGSFIEEDSA